MQRRKLHALFALMLVSLLWGASYPIYKYALRALTPAQSIVFRYGLAALVLAPALRHARRMPEVLRWGIYLGLINAAVYVLVATGLQASPSSSRVAFLMGTSVIMTPFIGYVRGREALHLGHLVGGLCSLGGLYAFTGFHFGEAGRADACILLGALIFACGLRVMHAATEHHSRPPWLLLCYEFCATSLFALPLWLLGTGSGVQLEPVMPAHLLALVYSALVPTIACGYLIASFQKFVGPTAAAVIYPLQSVFAYLVATGIFAEPIDGRTLSGGGLVLLAAVLPTLWQGPALS